MARFTIEETVAQLISVGHEASLGAGTDNDVHNTRKVLAAQAGEAVAEHPPAEVVEGLAVIAGVALQLVVARTELDAATFVRNARGLLATYRNAAPPGAL